MNNENATSAETIMPMSCDIGITSFYEKRYRQYTIAVLVVINECHEYQVFGPVIGNAVGLPRFDKATVASRYFGNGAIIIGKIAYAGKDVVRFCFMDMLMKSQTGTRWQDDFGIHAAMAHQFVFCQDMTDRCRTLAAGQSFYLYSVFFADQCKNLLITSTSDIILA